MSEPIRPTAAAELRREFDAQFAEPRHPGSAPAEQLLAIGVAGHRYALRLSEIAGVHADRRSTWVPTAVPEFLGLASLRGTLIPTYDLAALLHHAEPAGSQRWLAVCAGAVIGLAFESLEGQFRVPMGMIVPAGAASDDRSQCIREIVQTNEGARPLIHLPTVMQVVARLAGRHIDRLEGQR